ncbi:hypothetical protein L210DRAFT_3646120 [Boletus edulis BED1]|uniref:Uncharacterized protein n=1 Tax=Boletus edulis BED1 TaxID=1328754 RepID=A0AAD4BTC8_BOLED|nr:hypothetical protein L210DRAFT_3646120 [Boletus edulis BED1]
MTVHERTTPLANAPTIVDNSAAMRPCPLSLSLSRATHPRPFILALSLTPSPARRDEDAQRALALLVLDGRNTPSRSGRDMASRVVALEEMIIAEAEALNEAALAEVEGRGSSFTPFYYLLIQF